MGALNLRCGKEPGNLLDPGALYYSPNSSGSIACSNTLPGHSIWQPEFSHTVKRRLDLVGCVPRNFEVLERERVSAADHASLSAAFCPGNLPSEPPHFFPSELPYNLSSESPYNLLWNERDNNFQIYYLSSIMSAQATFRARYTDEDMLVGQLLEIFPGQRVQIKVTRQTKLSRHR